MSKVALHVSLFTWLRNSPDGDFIIKGLLQSINDDYYGA